MQLKLRGERDYSLTFLEQVLKNRGVQDVHSFFDLSWASVADPYDLDYIKEGIELLIRHIESSSKIVVLVDADMDGFASAAILINYIRLQQKNGDWGQYFPTIIPIFHQSKMHGLNDNLIMRDLRESIKPNLLIIPDASGSKEQYDLLTKLNIDILVLDHHDTIERGDGKNVIVINNQQSQNYKNKHFCGAGVVWQFLRALDDELSLVCADCFLDLVALANIADDMDLKSDETRFICNIGLTPGNLRNYFLVWCKRNLYNMRGKEYTPHNVGFYIAPLFNAVCRIGTIKEKQLLFKALLDEHNKSMVADGTRGHSGEVELVQEAVRLATNTKSRQDRKKNKLTELIEQVIEEKHMVQNKVLIFAFNDFEEDWRALTGVTAQQISQIYQRPCILTFLDQSGHNYVGSLRANDNIEAFENFKDQCLESNLCTFAAGHQQAAGIAFSADNIAKITEYFNNKYKDIDAELCYYVDFILDGDDPKIPDMIEELSNHESLWGTGLVEPRIAIINVKVDRSTLQLMGAKKTTLCIRNPYFKMLTFRSSKEEYDALLMGTGNGKSRFVTVVANAPEMNEFNRIVTPQLMIEDFETNGFDIDF